MSSTLPNAPADFDFRSLHPLVYMGTASDRYARWIGQIYTAERYKGSVKSCTHTIGGKTFTEEVLPVESVNEYFQYFRVLELDFTFYETLPDADGKPTPAYRALSAYALHMPEGVRVVLKVPQVVFARDLDRFFSSIPRDERYHV